MNSSANSTPEGLIKTLWTTMSAEYMAFETKELSPTAQIHKSAQEHNFNAVAAIGRSGDLQTLLTAERALLTNELERYGNSSGMKSSLGSALEEIKQAEKMHNIAQNKDRYREVDELYQRPKNRRRGLPYDEARQFFNAHNTRLLNQDRSRLSETDKKTLNARRPNMRIAEKASIAHQQKALGQDVQQDKKRGREMEL